MRVKFEIDSFNPFKLVSLTGPLHIHTHTQTHIEQKQYLCHSLHSVGIDNYGQMDFDVRCSDMNVGS